MFVVAVDWIYFSVFSLSTFINAFNFRFLPFSFLTTQNG